MAEKPAVPRASNIGDGGWCEMIADRWMVDRLIGRRTHMEYGGDLMRGPDANKQCFLMVLGATALFWGLVINRPKW